MLDKAIVFLLSQSSMDVKGMDTWNKNVPRISNPLVRAKLILPLLSDIDLEADFDDSDQDGIASTFTATIDSPKEAKELDDEEKEMMESKFEEMDSQDDIHTA